MQSIGETLHDEQDQQHVIVLRGRMRLPGRFLHNGQTFYPGLTMKKLLKNTESEKIKEICKSVPGTTKRKHIAQWVQTQACYRKTDLTHENKTCFRSKK